MIAVLTNLGVDFCFSSLYNEDRRKKSEFSDFYSITKILFCQERLKKMDEVPDCELKERIIQEINRCTDMRLLDLICKILFISGIENEGG